MVGLHKPGIFSLPSTSSPMYFGEYVLIHTVRHSLTFLGPLEDVPTGYLFLGPVDNFRRDTGPDSPAYWLTDPSGAERLTVEEARSLGFPQIQLELRVMALYWSETVYEGIRQFHTAKGYDPDGFDVAIELGCPLYELACSREDFQAHWNLKQRMTMTILTKVHLAKAQRDALTASQRMTKVTPWRQSALVTVLSTHCHLKQPVTTETSMILASSPSLRTSSTTLKPHALEWSSFKFSSFSFLLPLDSPCVMLCSTSSCIIPSMASER
ncbi:hypothetical protein FB45DRAFT_84805 [Roridomyces roridus]|uniref:Uncharacterized protein n=1 Tax=Roridomyces roridus TaxID=1738132 RepID=A0AAD7BLQ5_9AGAR|nr:hypothetical protein FB45DRAFT_84805 [Roridomyces roridus]